MTRPRIHHTHDCPGGCGQQVGHRHFACSSCWFRLPAPLRRAIRQHYAAGRVQAHAEAMAAAHRWYRDNPRTCPCKPSPDGRPWRSAGCRAHGVQPDDDLTTEERAELALESSRTVPPEMTR
ncbi:hypothetical protein [Saccharothrix sp. HUAS TT1]|uniref:hypothetical protein n=1 Tax=unclassified Saccharothrix TaxID=2593673 RepID=UPI00345B69DB